MIKWILGFILGIAVNMVSGQGYHIEITVGGIKDTTALLGYHFGNQQFIKDTFKIKDQIAIFEGDEPLLDGVYFFYTPNVFFEFIPGNQHFKMNTSGPGYVEKMKISGSDDNVAFNELQKYSVVRQKQMKELNEKLKNKELSETDKDNFKKQLIELNKEIEQKQEAVAVETDGSYAGTLFTAMIKPKIPDEIKDNQDPKVKYLYYKEHYFDNFKIDDEGLLRSPIYHGKILDYLENVTAPDPDSIIKSVDKLLIQAENNPVVFRYLLVTLSNHYEQSKKLGIDKVFVHLAENYYLNGKADWVNDELLSKMRKRTNELKPILLGKPAPPLQILDTSLNKFDIKSLDSKFTVLYFYDPDCGHCKKTIPVLVDAYPELKSKGAEVVAVSITTEIDKWKKFIKEYKLTCINGADPYVKSNFRYEYDIRTTPTIFVLDKAKKILAKGIAVEDITNIINHFLAIEGKSEP